MATYDKKRLKCFGTVAAGEHVAVTVTDGAQWIGEGTALRLRVLFGPDTVGVFPFADGDAWTATGTQNADAYCELNLNTLQAEKYLKHGGTCLWILDDVENHTLYATGEFEVLPWPKRRGIDEPIDLDGYPLLLDEIKDLEEAFEEYQRTVAQALAAKQDTIFDLATIRSGAAAGATAVQPSQIARFVDDAEYKAQYGEQNKPAILFKHGTNVIVALDVTPFVKDGMVSSVEIEDGNLVITFNTDAGQEPIEIPLTDIFDPDNYYDKTAADGKFVAKADVAATVTQDGANPVKSSGIWSALWGALTALPTGFTSLYDWCVAQLAGKQSTLSAQQLANIAAVSDALSFDATHSYAAGDPVVYNGTLYTFTATHTGAWTGSDVSAVDIIARLALKANDNAVVHLTGNETVDGVKTFDYEGVVVHNPQTGFSMKLLDTGIAVTDGSSTAYFYVPSIMMGGGTFALLSDVTGKADRDESATPGNLAKFDSQGNPTDSLIPAANVALKGDIPYTLGTPIIIDTASSETVEGETVNYGVATLVNRTANIVQVTAATALDELRITFPAATSGTVRDFGLRVEIGTGSAALAAPALVPIAPTGETIELENADGAIPALTDGTATAKGVTLLYFCETAPGVFVVKGEQVEEVA